MITPTPGFIGGLEAAGLRRIAAMPGLELLLKIEDDVLGIILSCATSGAVGCQFGRQTVVVAVSIDVAMVTC